MTCPKKYTEIVEFSTVNFYNRMEMMEKPIKSAGRFPIKRRLHLHPGLLLLICIGALFLNGLLSAAAVVILYLPQDFFRILTAETVLGVVSAVTLTAIVVLADRRSRKVLVPLLCVHLLSLAGSFFILFSCGYYHNLGKFVLFCLVIGQISGTFFSLTDIFPRKKIYYILYAGLVCLIFLKTIFLQIVDV